VKVCVRERELPHEIERETVSVRAREIERERERGERGGVGEQLLLGPCRAQGVCVRESESEVCVREIESERERRMPERSQHHTVRARFSTCTSLQENNLS
jgi:hypothetical protein